MNNEKIIISIFSWITVIITMLIVINFSLENGTKSTNTSDNVVDSVVEVIPNNNSMSQEQKDNLTHIIRKIAHFGIYMLLGFTIINAFNVTIKWKYIFSLAVSVILSSLFAMFDEFIIQAYSAGRVPLWSDVIIDFFGATVGALLFVSFISIYNLIKKQNKKKEILN
ncbi:MAG: VanZ family protein [Clostridia bacterium]|nr:VanZ family protein [Clostridia bacterium]